MLSASSVTNTVLTHSLFQSSKHQSGGAVAFQHSIQELHINSGFHGAYTFLPPGKAALRLLGLGFKLCFSRGFTGAGGQGSRVIISSYSSLDSLPSPRVPAPKPAAQPLPALLQDLSSKERSASSTADLSDSLARLQEPGEPGHTGLDELLQSPRATPGLKNSHRLEANLNAEDTQPRFRSAQSSPGLQLLGDASPAPGTARLLRAAAAAPSPA